MEAEESLVRGSRTSRYDSAWAEINEALQVREPGVPKILGDASKLSLFKCRPATKVNNRLYHLRQCTLWTGVGEVVVQSLKTCLIGRSRPGELLHSNVALMRLLVLHAK